MTNEPESAASDGKPRPQAIQALAQALAPVTLLSLPDGVLGRIVQLSSHDTRRQLRLVSRTLRPLVDACTPCLTLSSYSLPCLVSRGPLPAFAPRLHSITLELQDTTAPASFLARLPRLGLAELPHVETVTLALANDHLLPPSSLTDLVSAIPASTTRLVLTHMIGAGRPAVTPSGGGGGASQQLDLAALRHLLLMCPQIREVRLEGGCWVRTAGDLQALAALVLSPNADAAAAEARSPVRDGRPQSPGDGSGVSDGGGTARGSAAGAAASDGVGSVVISAIRGLYLDASDGYLGLARTMAALRGLTALDVQLVAAAPRQVPAAAADAAAGDVGGLMADIAAALSLAQLGLASEQLMSGLTTPALAGLTRLVVREFQGNTVALLGALEGLPLLAHLGLSGLDDAPYITDTHLELIARLPSLRHLSVDRLDISRDPQQQQPPFCPGSAAAPSGFGAHRWSSGGDSGSGGGILPALTGLEVALVVHSVPRLPHAFPAVQHLTLHWLWEQAMRKLAGWTSLTSLSLANLDCCLDWGLLRTLTGLTQLQLCRGSSYEQLAELLYLLRALPGLQVLRLSGWHCMRNSEPGRMALGLTRGLGAAAGRAAGGEPAAWGSGRAMDAVARPRPGEMAGGGHAGGEPVGAGTDAGTGRMPDTDPGADLDPSSAGRTRSHSAAGPAVERFTTGNGDTAAAAAADRVLQGSRPHTAAIATGTGAGASASAMAAAFAALDPDLHHAWSRIRAAADATAAAGAAMTLLRALPKLRSLELTDCGHPLLRCLASRPLLEDGGPLTGVQELRLCRLLDVVGSDVEEAVAALPGLRRLAVRGCWPVEGEALLRLEGLRRAGIDVVWRR